MARFAIDRRTVLRGIGGAALALPSLEIMSGPRGARAAAPVIPRRYCQMFAGSSCCGYGHPFTLLAPMKTGTNYDLPLGLKSLGGGKDSQGSYRWGNIQSHVGIVSGLKIPTGGGDKDPGGSIPPGGATLGAAHGSGMVPQSSGTREYSYMQYTTPSADQIAADILGGVSRRNIPLQVQPLSYDGGRGCSQFSCKKDGTSDAAEISPRKAFQAIFGQAQLRTTDPAAYAALIKRRKSVIDLVRDDSAALLKYLGGEDRRRIQRYYDEVVGLEKRLDTFASDPTCQIPAAPAEIPVGNLLAYTDAGEKWVEGNCWSNETLRAELLTDVIALAFQCNITNVASLLITDGQSFMNLKPAVGAESSVHGTSHQVCSLDAQGAGNGWHVNVFARLVARLVDMREVDGSLMIDHTAMVLFFEAGYGVLAKPDQNPQIEAYGKANCSDPYFFSHSMDNMVVLYAGRAGGLIPGQHLAYNADRGRLAPPGPQPHPAQVTLTCLRAIGHTGSLGEISETIPEMSVRV